MVRRAAQILERWESQAAAETSRSGPSNEQGAAKPSASVTECDIADVRPLFGKAKGEPAAARTVPGPMNSVRPVRPYDYQTSEKRTATMKLSSTAFVSVDGVMQGIGGPVIQ